MIKAFSRLYRIIFMFFAGVIISVSSFAQDKKIEVDIHSGTQKDNAFYMQPWAWAVGGAIFLLLLVAILRNNNSKA